MNDTTDAHPLLTRVPEITAYFWILKFFTTAMGESTSDYMVFHMNPYLAVALGGIGFAAALALKLWMRRFTVWSYWLTALMVAIFGTMAADVVHVAVGVPYIDSTTLFALALAAIFVLWHLSEKTLSIHSIYTTRREFFYWAAVFATFALGTAAGDLTATTFGLGYFSSGILFGVLIAVVAVAHQMAKTALGSDRRRIARNAVIAYWTAYILTRPFGASFADWLDKPLTVGGLGWGTTRVSLYLFVPILALVVFLIMSHGKAADLEPLAEDESSTAYSAK